MTGVSLSMESGVMSFEKKEKGVYCKQPWNPEVESNDVIHFNAVPVRILRSRLH